MLMAFFFIDYKFIRDDFLEKMRHIAYAATEEEYHVALEDLTSNNWYAENKQLQTYVKNRWLNIKEVKISSLVFFVLPATIVVEGKT